MRTSPILAAILCLIATTTASQAEPNFQLRWTANLNTLLETSPTLADLNNDGLDEILVAGREELIALDGTGKELWRWRTPGRFMTYPTVLKRDKGSDKGLQPLVYVADTTGAFSCIDGNGKLEWQAKLKAGSSWSAAVVYDLNNDGTPEVVQTDESGAVWAFDALTGKVIWQSNVKGIPVSPAISRRSANDPTPIIVIATGAGMLTALDGNGAVLWEQQIGGASQSWATAAPVIFGDSDGNAEIAAAASEGKVICLDLHGKTKWSRPTQGSIASTLSVGDLDRGGSPNIFCITQTGVIYRLATVKSWEIDMQGRSLAAGAILDVDGDGHMEYLVSTQAGRFMVFNDCGRSVFEHTFDNRTINVTPTFGNLTASSSTLDMVVSGGESGRVFCFSTNAPRDAARQWWQYRGPSLTNTYWRDAAIAGRTAPGHSVQEQRTIAPAAGTTSPHITPINLDGNKLTSGEEILFRIESASAIEKPYNAQVRCANPSGGVRSVLCPVVSQHSEIALPVDFGCGGNYSFEWRLSEPQGTIIDGGEHEISIDLQTNDRALIEKSIRVLPCSVNGKTSPLIWDTLNRKAAQIESDLRDTDRLTKMLQEIHGSPYKDLLPRARRALRIAETAQKAATLGTGTSIVVSQGLTWESRDVPERIPQEAENPLNVTRRVVPNEHEPVSLNLFNIIDRELQVRALVEAPTPGPAVVLHYSQSTPTGHGTVAWDPLPECDDSSVLSIPSLSSRELWLDVQVGPAAPGEHHVKVRLQALNGAGVLESGANPHDAPPPETIVDITLTVLPFEMAPASAMRLCAWATLSPAAVADMLAHGNNVFCAPPPELRFDDQKRLAGCDYAKLDAVLALLRGYDVVVLVQGLPAFQAAQDTPEYKADLKRYLDDLAQHLADAGFDAHHFALYPIDEPGGAGWNAVNQLVAFGKAVHEARPDIQIYMDGGGELPMFEAMATCIDIWCPAIVMLADDSPEMRVVRDSKKQLWSYDCGYGYATATRSSLKDTNIVADYRNAALFAVRHGGEGIGFWSYNIGTDPWIRVELDYPLVYPGRTKPITSRRWEAVREGIEDARILIALRDRAATLNDEKAQAAVKDLIETALPAMLDPSFKEMKLGLGRHAIDLSSSDETANAFRNKMLDCVELVCGKN